jgi:hypothetical protein
LPNTLAHLGLQTLTTRVAFRAPDPKWIYLGCVIPDLPWIIRRVVFALFPNVDWVDLRLYSIAQASLAVSLLLCGALALMSTSPKRIFAILSLNALLHLLLDALQIKWGNGVHLFAPFSWKIWNLGLFWPEGATTVVLTGAGLGIVLWAYWRGVEEPVGLSIEKPIRLILAAVLLSAYAVLPWMLSASVEASDSHFLHTIQSGPARAGQPVALDRTEFTDDGDSATLLLYNGEYVAVAGKIPPHSGVVSIQGRFGDRDTVVIEEFHAHAGRLRDLGSYVGLALVLLAWLLPVRRRAIS